MLRTHLQYARVLGGRPIAAPSGRQWPRLAAPSANRRWLADVKKPSTAPPAGNEPPPTTESDVGESVAGLLKSSPPPATPTPPTRNTKPAASPPPPPPPPKRGAFRRIRRLFTTLTLLTAVGFGGGIVFSRFNDNFYDFFTEYVPFGEQAVLYIEELDFRNKYKEWPSHRSLQTHDSTSEAKVHVPAQSGASWRVADSGEGKRQVNAVGKAQVGAKAKPQGPKQEEVKEKKPKQAEEKDRPESDKPAQPAPAPAPASAPAPAPASAPAPAPTPAKKKKKAPEKSAADGGGGRISHVQLLDVRDAKEPAVQDLVRLVNDVITVVNADNAQWKFSGTIDKAKDQLHRVIYRMKVMKADVDKKATAKARTQVDALEKEIQQLLGRFDKGLEAKEQQWRDELRGELEVIHKSYEDRVKLLLDRQKQADEERLKSRLAAQAVSLREEFLGQIRGQVEKEREGRLAKLEELSSAVKELESLTTGWNELVDASLKTQQLHVALEAVRAGIRDAERDNPRPFVRELVALKEIAEEDPVVDAAIASIPPAAYQRGIPSASALIDRFRRVAAEVRKAALLPDEAGVASHASSWMLSKVLFKKDGAAAGAARDGSTDVEAVLARTQVLLEEGDLDGAAREMNGLTGWAKTLSKDWLGEVRKVLEVRQALDVISTEARLQSLRMETSRT